MAVSKQTVKYETPARKEQHPRSYVYNFKLIIEKVPLDGGQKKKPQPPSLLQANPPVNPQFAKDI